MTCSGRCAATAPQIAPIRTRWAHHGSDSPQMTSATVYSPNAVPWRGLTWYYRLSSRISTATIKATTRQSYTQLPRTSNWFRHIARARDEWGENVYYRCEQTTNRSFLIFFSTSSTRHPSGRYTDADRPREGKSLFACVERFLDI